MLLIIVPRQSDAAAFITALRLKKDISVYPFPVYTHSREGIFLCISGEGAVHAANAVGFMMGRWGGKEDWLLHTGVCGMLPAAEPFDSNPILLYPHTIADAESGRCFYPEMLYRHPFNEGVLYTLGASAVRPHFHSAGLPPFCFKTGRPIAQKAFGQLKTPTESAVKYSRFSAPSSPFSTGTAVVAGTDGEAAYIFQAAARFIPLHRIITIKSAAGAADVPFAAAVAETVIHWLDNIRAAVSQRNAPELCFTDAEAECLESMADRLRLTAEMRRALIQASLGYKAKGKDLLDALSLWKDKTAAGKGERRRFLAEIMALME